MKNKKSSKKKSVTFSEVIKNVSKGKWDSVKLAFDYAYSKLRFHITAEEYMEYGFYDFKNRYRKDFLLTHHKKKIRNISTRSFTNSKYVFYKRIPELYHRGVTLVPYCGIDEFLNFARKYKNIVAKPDRGSLGIGLELFKYTDDDSARRFFEKFSKDTPMIVEEFISQHDKLNELNPFCVNTIRVISVLYEGEVEIVTAILKTATSPNNFCDNVHRGGIGTQVDVETGVVTSVATDGRDKCYFNHPITGVQFIGFRVPNWDAIISLVKEAHKKLPQCLLYGWDVTATPTGAVIVEANNMPDIKWVNMDRKPKGAKIIKLAKTVKFDQDYSKSYKFNPDYESYFTKTD